MIKKDVFWRPISPVVVHFFVVYVVVIANVLNTSYEETWFTNAPLVPSPFSPPPGLGTDCH